MTLRSPIALVTLSVLATVALAATNAEARPGRGQGHRPQARHSLGGSVPQAEAPAGVAEALDPTP